MSGWTGDRSGWAGDGSGWAGDRSGWVLAGLAALALAAGVARWVTAAPEPVPEPAPQRSAEATTPDPLDAQMAGGLESLPYRPADAVVGSAEPVTGGVAYGVSAPIFDGTYVFEAVCVGEGRVEFTVFQEEDPHQAAVDGARVIDVSVGCRDVPLPVRQRASISGEAVYVAIRSTSDTSGALVWQMVPV